MKHANVSFFLMTALLLAGTLVLYACNETPVTGGDDPAPQALSKQAAPSPHPMNADATGTSILPATGAVISNGTISLGVNDLGDLNYNGYGVRFLPTQGEAIRVGCDCEGWGVADAASGNQCWASRAFGVHNVTPVSFAHTAKKATSVVNVANTFKVTHHFRPSPATRFLYEIEVVVKNITANPIADVRYTRDMDWDVPPTPFDEYVTVQGFKEFGLYADNNGFQTPGPLFTRTHMGRWLEFTDYGPMDHGAIVDLGLGAIAPGAKKRLMLYYGAAGNETKALRAINDVGAVAYTLGQPNVPGGPDLGKPNTFIFAYKPVS